MNAPRKTPRAPCAPRPLKGAKSARKSPAKVPKPSTAEKVNDDSFLKSRAPDPLPIGASRKRSPARKRGAGVPAALIMRGIAESDGLAWRVVKFIRAHGFPDYSRNALSARFRLHPDLQAALDEAAQSLVSSAVDSLRAAVKAGEEWAVRQVLNSPRAADAGLGNTTARVDVAAVSASVVLDPIDQAQRLARLDKALATIRAAPAVDVPALPAPHDDDA